jgi:hypothetical protein
MNSNPKDADAFANIIRKTKIDGNSIQFGNFYLPIKKGVTSLIRENQSGYSLIGDAHEYTIQLLGNQVELSIQLYRNVRNHFRFYAFTKSKGKIGMTFSLNLTTEKDSQKIIFLSQKAKFSEQYSGNEKLAKEHRQQKQFVFCEILKKIGIELSDNNDIILGIFDPQKELFVNTSAKKFLNDFIVIALIKGHFQGNKGYELDILPSFQKVFDYTESTVTSTKNEIKKITKQIGSRVIPMGLRYKILNRDKSKCLKCGRSAKEGVILHIDHIKPFSLGGLTVLSNLRTLCHECNIGRSNKYED